jgi:predicted Zn-ribbon and HTH transcriptional regulator
MCNSDSPPEIPNIVFTDEDQETRIVFGEVGDDPEVLKVLEAEEEEPEIEPEKQKETVVFEDTKCENCGKEPISEQIWYCERHPECKWSSDWRL